MPSSRRLTSALALAAAIIAMAGATRTFGQAALQPTNDAPNPYQSIEGWAKLPEGRTWGSTSAVDVDKDGKSIWVGERCGGYTPQSNGCIDRTTGKMSDTPSILKFDSTGKLVKSFGGG